MNPIRTILAALCLCTVFAAAARADSNAADCLSDDNERRIAGCTQIIEDPATAPLDRSNALAMRGLALSIKGLLDRAIDDYNASLAINPNSPSALNNRAWAYFRAGLGQKGAARHRAVAAAQSRQRTLVGYAGAYPPASGQHRWRHP